MLRGFEPSCQSISRVTVVVVTRNRRDQLLDTLGRLRSMVPVRIIVVDNASTDGSADAVAAQHPRVELIRLDENLGAAAHNVGVTRARTDVVAFCDGDSWWEEGAMEEAVALFDRHPRLGLVAGRVVLGDGSVDPACVAMAASPLPSAPGLPASAVLGFLACGAVVRRQAFLAAGGFHGRLGAGVEAQLLALDLAAAGWGLAYVDGIVAQHRPSPPRDVDALRRTVLRNVLWVAWLRRSPRVVAARTLALAARSLIDRHALAALVAAVCGLLWVRRERRLLPAEVEGLCRILEGAPPASAARSRASAAPPAVAVPLPTVELLGRPAGGLRATTAASGRL